MRASNPAFVTPDNNDEQAVFLAWKQQTTSQIAATIKVERGMQPMLIPVLGKARNEIEAKLRPENQSKGFGVLRVSCHETVTYAYKRDERVKPFFHLLLEMYNRMQASPDVVKKVAKVYEPSEIVVFSSTVSYESAALPQIMVDNHEFTRFQLGEFHAPNDIIILSHPDINMAMMPYLMNKICGHSHACITQSKTTDEALDDLAKAIWYFVQFLPYLRGTATNTEILLDAHLEILRTGPIFNGQVPVYCNKIPLDWMAFFSPTPEIFAQEFKKSCRLFKSYSQATLFKNTESDKEREEASKAELVAKNEVKSENTGCVLQ